MALIFLPVVAAVGLMFATNLGDSSFTTQLGMVVFAALAIGVFASVFKMAWGWENEAR